MGTELNSQSRVERRLAWSRSLFVLLSCFVALNAFLFLQATEKTEDGQTLSATYWNASDGQRYWGVGLNLSQGKGFTVPSQEDEPLTRAGPIPALFFSIPMYLVAFENAPLFIVSAQCALLLIMGFLTASLASSLRLSPYWCFGLVIFNPNLIGLAHHAQSDLLFAFVFLLTVYLSVRMLLQEGSPNLRAFVILGFVCAVLALTRGVGKYYGLALPILIMIATWIRSATSSHKPAWRKLTAGFVVYAIVWSLTTSPWAIRNHLVLDDFGLTQSEAIMMRDQYRFMLRQSGLDKDLTVASPDSVARTYLAENNLDPACIEKFKDRNCKKILMRAYMEGIQEAGVTPIVHALARAWSSLYFSGAASRLANYIGLDVTRMHELLLTQYEGAKTIMEYARRALREIPLYFGLLLIGLVFAFSTRMLGVIGAIRLVFTKSTLAPSLFFLFSTGLLTAAYMFVGISRYRAPLEPILMIFAVAAFGFSGDQRKSLDGKKTASKESAPHL